VQRVTERKRTNDERSQILRLHLKDRAGKKPIWTKIGSAWSHEKGGGFNIELQALPMDGRIVLMPPKDEPVGGAD